MKWRHLLVVLVVGITPARAETDADGALLLRATPEDCAIFAVLGRQKLNWTADTPPKGTYSANSTEYDDGHAENISKNKPDRRYTAQCNWHDFGLAEPVPGDPARTYSFWRPNYYDQAHADASWSSIVLEKKDEQYIPHSTIELCRMQKRESEWEIVSCKNMSGYQVNSPEASPDSAKP